MLVASGGDIGKGKDYGANKSSRGSHCKVVVVMMIMVVKVVGIKG